MADSITLTKEAAIKKLNSQFNSQSLDHLAWARKFLDQLFVPVLSDKAREAGFLKDYPVEVWLDGEEHPRQLITADRERGGESENNYLFPSDTVMLLTQLATKLKVPTQIASSYFNRFNLQSRGYISERELMAAKFLYELAENEGLYAGILGKLRILDKEVVEQEKIAGDTEDERGQQQSHEKAVATAAVPAAAVDATAGTDGDAKGDDGDGVGDKEQVVSESPPTEPSLLSPSFGFTREQTKTIRYESAWIFHHAAFDLLGETGFNANDQRFIELKKEVDEYFAKGISQEKLQQLFANPGARLEVLREIYIRLSSNVQFVKATSLQTQVIQEKADRVKSEIPSAESHVSVTDLKKLASKLIGQELGSRLEIDGDTLLNLGYTIDAMALGLGNQQLAAQLGLKASERKDVDKFVSSLTADQIELIFFGGKASTKLKELLAKLEKENRLLEIQKLLAGAITARAVDISIISESTRVLQGIATETDLAALKRSSPNNTLIPHTRNEIAQIDKLDGIDGTETVTEAKTKAKKITHTEFETHAAKIWSSLSVNAQEWAYAEWLGLKPADMEMLKGNDGTLPFNQLLAHLDWNTFVNKARNLDKLLAKLGGAKTDIATLQQIGLELRALNVSDLLREAWLKQYLFGLNREQLAFLAKTEYVRRVEKALDTAEQLVGNNLPGTQEWQEATIIVENTDKLIDNDKLAASLHPMLADEYYKQLSGLKRRHSLLLAEIDRKQLLALPTRSQDALSEVQKKLLEAEKALYLAEFDSDEYKKAVELLNDAKTELESTALNTDSALISDEEQRLRPQLKKELVKLKAKYSSVINYEEIPHNEKQQELLKVENSDIYSQLKQTHILIIEAESLLLTQEPLSAGWELINTKLIEVNRNINSLTSRLDGAESEIKSNLLLFVKGQVTALELKARTIEDRASAIRHGAQHMGLRPPADIENISYEEAVIERINIQSLLAIQEESPPDSLPMSILSEYGTPAEIPEDVETYNQEIENAIAREELGLAGGAIDAGLRANAEIPMNRPQPIAGVNERSTPKSIPNQASRAVGAAKSAVETAKNISLAARAAAGDVTAAAQLGLKATVFLSNPENRRKIAKIAGGIIIGGAGLIGALASRIFGLVGGTGGAIIGGIGGATAGAMIGSVIFPGVGTVVGGVIGGGLGAWAGYQAGERLATKYALEGIADLYPSQTARGAYQQAAASQGGAGATSTTSGAMGQGGSAQTATGVQQGSAPTTSGQLGNQAKYYDPTSHGRPVLSTHAVGTPAASAGSAAAAGATTGLLATGSMIFVGPALALGTIYFLTIGTIFTIFSAFLVPMPVGDATNRNTSQSEYLDFYKTATPKEFANNETREVEYKITINPSRGYKILITNIEDEFSFLLDRVKQPTAQEPTLSPSANYLPATPTTPGATTIELVYQITMTGGVDVLVRNAASIRYNVYDNSDQLIATDQTLGPTTFSVIIGNPQVLCWPTSGTIVQLPYGSYSHSNTTAGLDAYDITAPLGTRIFAPFEGDAHREGSLTADGYGLSVVLETTMGNRLRFGHFSRVSSRIPALGSGTVRLQPGEELGRMGSSGFSTGSHLHYENEGSYQGGVRRRILDTLIPEVPTIGQRVYTCY